MCKNERSLSSLTFRRLMVNQKAFFSFNEFILNKTLYGSDYYMIVTKGHFRSIKTDFIMRMGDWIMRKIAYENPRRFLFE